MNTDYDILLHEIYFGKNIRTKLLEKAFNCFAALTINENNHKAINEFNQLNKQVEDLINNLEKEKIIFMKQNNINSIRIKAMLDMRAENIIKHENIICRTYSKNSILYKTTLLIENMIKYIFGFDNILFKIIDKSDMQKGHVSAFIYALNDFTDPHFISGRSNIKDNYGRELSYTDVINAIHVSNTGIAIDWKRFASSSIIFFPELCILGAGLTGGECLAIMLHEIGHKFFHLVLPYTDFNAFQRSNEKFADKFVSLYGYSKEFADAFMKIRSAKNYIDYTKFKMMQSQDPNMTISQLYKTGIDYILNHNLYKQNEITKDKMSYYRIDSEQEKLKKALKNKKLTDKEKEKIQDEINYLNFMKQQIDIPLTDIDEHPIIISRLESQLQQLNIELKNNNITNSQRKRILNDIKKVKEQIKKAKKADVHVNNVYSFPKDNYEEFKEYDKYMNKLMTDGSQRKYLNRENDEEYLSKTDSRMIMNAFNNIHAKTKRESLMITNFKQFFNYILNENANQNKCTILFEKYLIFKYEKNAKENMIDYAQRICRIKIKELIMLCEKKYNITAKKHKGTKSDIFSMIHDSIFQYNKENDNLNDITKDDIDFINIVFPNKIFISPCKFNFNGEFENIDYDKDELKRIENLYKKYYLS